MKNMSKPTLIFVCILISMAFIASWYLMIGAVQWNFNIFDWHIFYIIFFLIASIIMSYKLSVTIVRICKKKM